MNTIISRILNRYKNWPRFTFTDVLRFTGSRSENLSELMHYLIKKKRVNQIKKGVYTLRNIENVVGFAFSPFYYGLQHALSYLNIWNQVTNPIIITTKNVRTGKRFIGHGKDLKIQVHHIQSRYFFGFDLINDKVNEFNIPVSTAEKTFIDFIYYKIILDDDTYNSIVKKINLGTLKQFLEIYPKKIQKDVMNKYNKYNKNKKS